ncbi:N-acetyltransferase [Bacillus sp. Marseille-Q1617]|uniref:GNAT family N-acetyltransferase n=1 Tax=Bacillus sp. Marseille-Q1617 TaxID=2736887 RepID=UPI001588B1EE|nr:GNAT family N-acetyltransferase [Bacillus sp. Marseille-Q1617]
MIKRIDINKESSAKEVLHLQYLSYAIEAKLIGYDDLPPLKDTLASIQQSGETFFGYHDNEELWGVISFKIVNHVIDIHRLMVHPNHFRKKVAEKLMSYLEVQGKENDSMVVSTGTDNTPALNFYIKYGFEIMGEKEMEEGLWITTFRKILM